jgi:hypothetical protein
MVRVKLLILRIILGNIIYDWYPRIVFDVYYKEKSKDNYIAILNDSLRIQIKYLIENNYFEYF